MPRTAGANDKTQRTRRKQTGADKKQRKETLNATKEKNQQEEKEEAERLRPANTFFLPRSTIRQRSNDNDGNSNTVAGDSIRVDGVANDGENHDGGEENDDAQSDNVEQNEDEDEAVTIEIDSGSTREITPKDIVATLDVEEEDDDCDEDNVDEDEDGNIINNDKHKKKRSKSNGVMREVLKAVQDRLRISMAWTCWTVAEVRTESSPSTKISSLNGVVGRWVWKCLRTYLQKSGIVTIIAFRRSAVMDS